MRFLLFGATGMVGQGVLRECLHAADVDYVQTVGRTPTGQLDPRLHDLVHHDLTDYRSIEASLSTCPWSCPSAGSGSSTGLHVAVAP